MAVKEAREAQSAWEDPLRGGQGKRHPIILQQSVTMLAYMDKNNASAEKTPTSFWDSMGVTHSRDLPILVGAATGAIGLIVIILTAVVIWHCCTRNGSNDKAYVVENLSRSSSVSRPATSNMVQSDSVIFLSAKSRRPTGSRMDEASPSTEAADTMSQLHSVHISHRGGGDQYPEGPRLCNGFAGRPLSECGVRTMGFVQPSSAPSLDGEVTLQVPSLSQCSSYNPLDESLYNPYGSSELTLKTRSLPSWGRSKQRPLSTEDDIGELYAKVNFSKRRKNRMRNDSAAAIAATRSYHQQRYLTPFHTLPSAHNDTDSLVDNEAVVVYDERTAV
ncbi:unnamed protein product [Ixodes pacificus]